MPMQVQPRLQPDLRTLSADKSGGTELEPSRELAELARKCMPSIWRQLSFMGVHEADVQDVCQQVFVLALRRWTTFRGESSREAWLHGIARNCASNYRKALHRRTSAHQSYGAVQALSLEAEKAADCHMESSESLNHLKALLDQLPEDVRIVYVLYMIEGLEMSEIAYREGIPLQTGYSRLNAARKLVREGFEAFDRGGV